MVMTTLQFRVYGNTAVYQAVEDALTLTRHLYNAALEHRKTVWERVKHRTEFADNPTQARKAFKEELDATSYKAHNKELTGIRADFEDYASLNRRLEVAALKRLDDAYKSFFSRAAKGLDKGHPRFKPAHRFRTLGVANVQAIKFVGNTARVKGIGKMRFRKPIPENAVVKSFSITKKGRRLWLQLQVEMPDDEFRLPRSADAVGIDMGVNDRAMLSTGEAIPRVELDWKGKRRHQRRLARAKKGSRARAKKRAAYANFCKRERIRVRNATHQASAAIVKKFSRIAVEDLNLPGMTRQVRKAEDGAPRKGVAQKRGLNREILAQNLGQLREQIAYKAERAGRDFMKVPSQYTSQTCSLCLVRDVKSRKSKRFGCTACGYELDADLNAAHNVLRLAFGEDALKPLGMRSAGRQLRLPMGDLSAEIRVA